MYERPPKIHIHIEREYCAMENVCEKIQNYDIKWGAFTLGTFPHFVLLLDF
jgi:hypothetical protein